MKNATGAGLVAWCAGFWRCRSRWFASWPPWYLLLLACSPLLRLRWFSDRTRRLSTKANRDVTGRLAGTRLGGALFQSQRPASRRAPQRAARTSRTERLPAR